MDLFGTGQADSSSSDDDQDDVAQPTQDGQPNTTIMSVTNPNQTAQFTKEGIIFGGLPQSK